MNDLLLTDFDLEIKNGDFVIGDSENQSVELLLVSSPGDWKQYPQVGCDIQKSLKGNISRFLERNISVQLQADGFKIDSLEISDTGINLQGSYEISGL